MLAEPEVRGRRVAVHNVARVRRVQRDRERLAPAQPLCIALQHAARRKKTGHFDVWGKTATPSLAGG